MQGFSKLNYEHNSIFKNEGKKGCKMYCFSHSRDVTEVAASLLFGDVHLSETDDRRRKRAEVQMNGF